MKHSLVLAALLLAASTANASVLRLDFIGSIPGTGGEDRPLSGFILIDDSIPDTGNQFAAFYENAVIGGMVTLDALTYNYIPSIMFNGVLVQNDFDGIDTVQFATGLFDPETNDFETLLLQFADSTGTVFDDESIPTSLSLADFDELTFVDGFPRGTYAGIAAEHGPLSFVELRVIPLPAPAWLLLSAMFVIRARRAG